MKQDLFEEFPTTDHSIWEKQVLKELKGETAESLNWENENGFSVPAYFSKEQVPSSYHPAFTHSDWKVTVKHRGRAEEVNAQSLRDLRHGAEGLSLSPQKGELEKSLQGIQLDLIGLQLQISAGLEDELHSYLSRYYKGKSLAICLFPEKMNKQEDLQAWQRTVTSFSSFKNVLTTSVDGLEYTSQNALPYYELALVFSQLIEHLNASKVQSGKAIAIRSSCDTGFFMQIAKLRAYRRLWKLIAKEFGQDNPLYLCVESEVNSLSLSDSYNNLLRNTLSGMAAVLGGCNELCILPHDLLLKGDSAFSSRLAMNQQFIFKHESYLDKMGDVACGSYYIESLTDLLCRKALEAIKAIEKNGGYFKTVATGEIEEKLKEQNELKVSAIGDKKLQLIGVNKYRNESENIGISEEQLRFIKQLAPKHPLLGYELQHLQKV